MAGQHGGELRRIQGTDSYVSLLHHVDVQTAFGLEEVQREVSPSTEYEETSWSGDVVVEE